MGKEAVGSWADRWERYLCVARCNGQLLTPVRAVPVTTKKDLSQPRDGKEQAEGQERQGGKRWTLHLPRIRLSGL